MMTIKPGKNYMSDEAPMKNKILWDVLMAAIAVLFLSSGGLNGAKSVKTITGFPVFILELAATIGFILFFLEVGLGNRKERPTGRKKMSAACFSPRVDSIASSAEFYPNHSRQRTKRSQTL